MGKVAEFTEAAAAGELRFISLLLGQTYHRPIGSISHYPVGGSVRQNQVTMGVQGRSEGDAREYRLASPLHGVQVLWKAMCLRSTLWFGVS